MFCSICSSVVGESDEVCAASCGHCFHRKCIENSLRSLHACPVCLKPLEVSSLLRLFVDHGDKQDQRNLNGKFKDEITARDKEIFDLHLSEIKLLVLRLRQKLDEAVTANRRLKDQNVELERVFEDYKFNLKSDKASEFTYKKKEFRSDKKFSEIPSVLEQPIAPRLKEQLSNYGHDDLISKTARKFGSAKDIPSVLEQPAVPKLWQEIPSFNDISPFGSEFEEPIMSQTRKLFSDYDSVSKSSAVQVSCKACKTGCAKGYCKCNKNQKGCTSACGCTGCINPYGKNL